MSTLQRIIDGYDTKMEWTHERTAKYYSGERTCDYCTWTQFRLQVKSNVDTCTV